MNVSIFANHYFHFFNLSDGVKTNYLISFYIKKNILYLLHIYENVCICWD